jgi:hypothetical protein
VEGHVVILVAPVSVQPIISLRPTAAAPKERKKKKKKVEMKIWNKHDRKKQKKNLMGDDSQICKFGVCLFITKVPRP